MTSRRAIGIDIGGTKIAVAAVDDRGCIHAREEIATEAEQGFKRAVGRMVEVATRVLERCDWRRDDLCGIGVGCAGPVSAARGIINNPYTLPTWVECDIVSALAGAMQCRVYLENDADAAALGEWFAGAARDCARVVMLTLGTGVGGGAVIDGSVYRAARGEHPELGHIPIAADGPACYCGTRGCLESIAAGPAIADAGSAAGLGGSREVFASGDPQAQSIVDRVQWALETATWTILHTFMPELIVLGGGIGEEHFERFAPGIRRRIEQATMVPEQATRLVKAQLGNDAGIVGAASLALTGTAA